MFSRREEQHSKKFQPDFIVDVPTECLRFELVDIEGVQLNMNVTWPEQSFNHKENFIVKSVICDLYRFLICFQNNEKIKNMKIYSLGYVMSQLQPKSLLINWFSVCGTPIEEKPSKYIQEVVELCMNS